MANPKIINFPHAVRVYGSDKNIVAEVLTITPNDATQWLRANRNNRPVRKRHVTFLANEITAGNWQVNGQAIVIAEDEQILDGQHRLFAIIEAGKPIQSLVVYGITPEAFRTIDTGAVRTGADALALYFHDISGVIVKALATAVVWCNQLEGNSLARHDKISNTDVIKYAQAHPSLIACCETLQSYPKEARPISLGAGAALFEIFQRKHEELAQDFMRKLFTGEELTRTDPEYLLRAAFIKNIDQVRKFPMNIRMRMVIKGWNWRRRGKDIATKNTITVGPNDDPRFKIF